MITKKRPKYFIQIKRKLDKEKRIEKMNKNHDDPQIFEEDQNVFIKLHKSQKQANKFKK